MADDLVLSLTGMDWIAILVAVVVAMFLGFLWFTPLFGKRWAKEMGMDIDMKPTAKQMAFSMTLFAIGNLLMAYVLWHEIHAWIPTLWAEHLGMDPAAVENSSIYMYGVWAALFNWLGFLLPLELSRIAWERASWTLFAINAGWELVRVFAMAMVLAALSGQL